MYINLILISSILHLTISERPIKPHLVLIVADDLGKNNFEF